VVQNRVAFVPKPDEITLAELFARDDKEHPSGRRPGDLAQSLTPKIKVELSKQRPEIDWDSLKDSIEDKAVAMLNIQLVKDILLPAWRQYQDLDSRISDDPEGKVVWLAQHTVSSVHHPQLVVLSNGVRTATVVGLDVAADFTLNGFGLVVQRGKISKIRTGTIEGAGSLAFKDLKLKTPFGKIELANEIQLDEAIPLR
jgi:hypothetical protein